MLPWILVTLIGLQVLGSISSLYGNEPSMSSNLHESKSVEGKGELNVDSHMDVKKINKINNNPEQGNYQPYFTIFVNICNMLVMYKHHPYHS